jgi:ABC-type tungstate transport system permease subunit
MNLDNLNYDEAEKFLKTKEGEDLINAVAEFKAKFNLDDRQVFAVLDLLGWC